MKDKHPVKIFTLLLLVALFILLVACNNSSNNSDNGNNSDNDNNNEQQQIEAKVTDYYPIKPNAKYTYVGTGNEFASYTVYVDYTLEDKVQYKKVNPGTHVAEIVSVKNGQVTKLYTQGEAYYREDYLRNPNLITLNKEEILLKEPLKSGNSWNLPDGTKATITKTDAQVNVGQGSFMALEVTKEEIDGSKTVNYYAKGVGLVKSTFIVNGIEEVVIGIQKLEENAKNTIDIRFYYPNVNDDKIYYLNSKISYQTNDITRKKIEEAYKSTLTDALKSQGLIRVLTPNTKINFLYLTKNNVVRTDISQDFIKELNLGAGYESLVLKSLTNTLAGYYNTDMVHLTVANDNYSSGHIYLEDFQYLYADFKNTVEIK